MVTETERGPQTPPSEEEILEHYANEAELFFKTPYVFKKPIKKVAVIGAGPAGVSRLIIT
jgi:NADPH-dependent glutamate synthase beta subunit-like oxidoreductase